ncbi:MAG: sll1863 family stress response protein, partial [Desulfurivibrionaceae bacterium]
VKYAKQLDDLELGIEATKAKLKELGEANEDAWEHLKAEIESAWGALRNGVRDIAAKLNK